MIFNKRQIYCLFHVILASYILYRLLQRQCLIGIVTLQTTTIDYSLYMKDVEQFMNQCEGVDEESAMQKLVDQKNYLEERNR